MNTALVEITEEICAFLAFLTNSIILFLIISKSPKTLGTYKYLMIYISLFEVFYAILNLLSPSQVFTLGSGFLVVMDQEKAVLPVRVCILLYFTMFGTSLANFGVHFIYRYLVVTGHEEYTSFSPLKLFIWISSPLVFGVAYTISCAYFMGKSVITEKLMQTTVLNSRTASIDSFVYMGFHIYPSPHEVNWFSIMGVMVVSTLIVFSISVMLFFGIKCYQELKKLTTLSTVSQNYRSIQNQLFLALVFQTLIPYVLMHLPSTFIVIFCFLDTVTSIWGVIGVVFIAFYPVLDPLPNIFIIKPYRYAFLRIVCCSKKWGAEVEPDSLPTMVTVSTHAGTVSD